MLINNEKYIKISSINNYLGQFDVFIKFEITDSNIYFFEVIKDDKNTIYKAPEPHVLKELNSIFAQNEVVTDVKPSDENSKAAQLYKERLNA